MDQASGSMDLSGVNVRKKQTHSVRRHTISDHHQTSADRSSMTTRWTEGMLESTDEAAKVQKFHVSFGTERIEGGGAAFPILLDQCSTTINDFVDGWKMQERLPIGIIDKTWWPKWEAQLKDSDGVLVIDTPTYRAKLAQGGELQAKGEPSTTDGMGIKREADRIIAERRERGESFKVFVVDGKDIVADSLIRLLSKEDASEANYEGWQERVEKAGSNTKNISVAADDELKLLSQMARDKALSERGVAGQVDPKEKLLKQLINEARTALTKKESDRTHEHCLAQKEKEVSIRIDVGSMQRVREAGLENYRGRMPATKIVNFFLEAQWEDAEEARDGYLPHKGTASEEGLWDPGISLTDHWGQNVPVIYKSEWYTIERTDERAAQWPKDKPAHVRYSMSGKAILSHPRFHLTPASHNSLNAISTSHNSMFNAIYESPEHGQVQFCVGDEITMISPEATRSFFVSHLEKVRRQERRRLTGHQAKTNQLIVTLTANRMVDPQRTDSVLYIPEAVSKSDQRSLIFSFEGPHYPDRHIFQAVLRYYFDEAALSDKKHGEQNGVCLLHVNSRRKSPEVILKPSPAGEYPSTCELEQELLGQQDMLTSDFNLRQAKGREDLLEFIVGSTDMSGSLEHLNTKFWHQYQGKRCPSLGRRPTEGLDEPKEIRVRLRIVQQTDMTTKLVAECSWTDFVMSSQGSSSMIFDERTNQVSSAGQREWQGTHNPFVPHLRVQRFGQRIDMDGGEGKGTKTLDDGVSRVSRKASRWKAQPTGQMMQELGVDTCWYEVYWTDAAGATYYDQLKPAVVCMRTVYTLPHTAKISAHTRFLLDSSRWATGTQVQFVKNTNPIYQSNFVDHSGTSAFKVRFKEASESEGLEICFESTQKLASISRRLPRTMRTIVSEEKEETGQAEKTEEDEEEGDEKQEQEGVDVWMAHQEFVNIKYRYRPSRKFRGQRSHNTDKGSESTLPAVGEDPYCGMLNPKNVRVRLNVRDIRDVPAMPGGVRVNAEGGESSDIFIADILLEASWTAFGLDHVEGDQGVSINSTENLDFCPDLPERQGLHRVKKGVAQRQGPNCHWTPRIYIMAHAKERFEDEPVRADESGDRGDCTGSDTEGGMSKEKRSSLTDVMQKKWKEEEKVFMRKLKAQYRGCWVEAPKERVQVYTHDNYNKKYAGGKAIVCYRIEGRTRLQKVGDLYAIRIHSFWSNGIVHLQENTNPRYQSQAKPTQISRIQFLQGDADDSLTVVLHRVQKRPKEEDALVEKYGLKFLDMAYRRGESEEGGGGHCLGKAKGEELTEPKVVRISVHVIAISLPQNDVFECDFRMEASWTDYSANNKEAVKESSTSERLMLQPKDSKESAKPKEHWTPRLSMANTIDSGEANISEEYSVYDPSSTDTSAPAVVCYVLTGRSKFAYDPAANATNESGAEHFVVALKSAWTAKQVKLEENINPQYRSAVKCELRLGPDHKLDKQIGFKLVLYDEVVNELTAFSTVEKPMAELIISARPHASAQALPWASRQGKGILHDNHRILNTLHTHYWRGRTLPALGDHPSVGLIGPKIVRVRWTVFKIFSVDQLHQRFGIDFELEASWTDHSLKGKYPDDAKNGPPHLALHACKTGLNGKKITSTHWCPRLTFPSHIKLDGDRENSWFVLYEADASGRVYDAEQPVIVCWRLHKQATFLQRFDLRMFPLDAQRLTVEVKAGYSLTQVRLVQNRNPKYKSLCRVEFFSLHHEFYLSGDVTIESAKTLKSHSASNNVYSLLRLNAKLLRKSASYQLRVVLPLFFLLLLAAPGIAVTSAQLDSSDSESLQEEDLNQRLMIPFVLFLATYMVLSHNTEMLPATTTTTFIDRYVLFVLLAIFVISMLTVFTSPTAVEWISSLGWTSAQSTANSDTVSWLVIGWVGLHLVMQAAILCYKDSQILQDEYVWWRGGPSTINYLTFPRGLYCGQWYKLLPDGWAFNFLHQCGMLSDLVLFATTKSVDLLDDQGISRISTIRIKIIDRRRDRESKLIVVCDVHPYGTYKFELLEDIQRSFEYKEQDASDVRARRSVRVVRNKTLLNTHRWPMLFSRKVGRPADTGEKYRVDCRWLVDSMRFLKFDENHRMHVSVGQNKAQREGAAAHTFVLPGSTAQTLYRSFMNACCRQESALFSATQLTMRDISSSELSARPTTANKTATANPMYRHKGRG